MTLLEHMRLATSYAESAEESVSTEKQMLAAQMAAMHYTAALALMRWSEDPYNDGVKLEDR